VGQQQQQELQDQLGRYLFSNQHYQYSAKANTDNESSPNLDSKANHYANTYYCYSYPSSYAKADHHPYANDRASDWTMHQLQRSRFLPDFDSDCLLGRRRSQKMANPSS